MKRLFTIFGLVCVLAVIRADVSELIENKDNLYLSPKETQQHISQTEISENKISIPKALSASLTVLRSNPQILLLNKEAVLAPTKDDSSSHNVAAAASSKDYVKTKPVKPASKSVIAKKRKTPGQSPKKAKHQSQSSNSHGHIHNKDYEFVPSANAPEVIYRSGDNIIYDDVPYHDILDNADPTYSASNTDTDKRADGYHYNIPLQTFVH